MILHVIVAANAVPDIVLVLEGGSGKIQVNVVEDQRVPHVPQTQIVALISYLVACPEHARKKTQQNYLLDPLVVKVPIVLLEFVIIINAFPVDIMANHVFPNVIVVKLIFIQEVVVVII
jgi:hypothetical protein